MQFQFQGEVHKFLDRWLKQWIIRLFNCPYALQVAKLGKNWQNQALCQLSQMNLNIM